jgi:phosphoglycerate dehydrogenase-like enzyme
VEGVTVKGPTVLIAAAIEDGVAASLVDAFPDVAFVNLPKDGEVPASASDAEILFRCAMSKEEMGRTIAGAPGLRWIHTCSAGFDQLLVPEIEALGLAVTRSAATHHIPISEWVIGFMLLVSKRFPDLMDAQRQHRWAPPDTEDLMGKTIGIVGAGAIGTEVARRARPFGMDVIATKRSPIELPEYDRVMASEDLPKLLEESDFVVLACPLTTETEGMIAAAQLRMMKPSAYLINIARGRLVVEADLIQALRDRWIAGACIDAFAQEPLPAESPLWDTERLILTPHSSYRSPHMMARAGEEFAANLRRYMAGEPLANRLHEPRLGY